MLEVNASGTCIIVTAKHDCGIYDSYYDYVRMTYFMDGYIDLQVCGSLTSYYILDALGFLLETCSVHRGFRSFFSFSCHLVLSSCLEYIMSISHFHRVGVVLPHMKKLRHGA